VKGVDTSFLEISNTIESINRGLPKNKTEVDYKEIRTKLNQSVSSPTKAELRRSILTNLKNTYQLGWNTSHRAVQKAAKENDAPERFVKRINDVALLSEKKMCVVKEWTFINFVEGLSLDVAESWFKSQAFTITGDLTQEMIDKAIQVMTNGINNEWSTKEMTNELEDVLINLTGGTDKQERARLETIVRTNMSTIFTQAQLAYYSDPDLNGFVEALQYTSVLDHRTTPICERLNDSVYAVNNPIWGFITPPNHFNCRSVLLPVTVLDQWSEDTKKFTENQLPGKGFGRSGLADFLNITLND